jgi:hypothetical protein
LLPVLPHDPGARFQANADGDARSEEGKLGGNPRDDILGG